MNLVHPFEAVLDLEPLDFPPGARPSTSVCRADRPSWQRSRGGTTHPRIHVVLVL
jgi:hypothetical protein